MSRQYNTYTEINFTHGYYTDGLCGDFKVLPTSDTASLLPKYRLLWGAANRNRPSTYQLLREYAAPATPLLPLPSSYQLRFELHLTHPQLINFTQGLSPGSKDIYFFENQPDAISLMGANFRKMILVAGMAHVKDLPPAATLVTVTPPGGGSTWTVASYEENGVRQARANLEGKVPGIYGLSWSGGSTEVYHDPSVIGKGVFGILHLTVSPPSLDIAANAYTLGLVAKSVQWKYFLMLKEPPHSGSTYNIINGNISGNGNFSFSSYPTGSWDPVQDPQPADLAALSNNAEIQAFISSAPIPYREGTRSLIKLDRSGTNARVVVNDLPNPFAGAANAAVLVSVDKPTP